MSKLLFARWSLRIGLALAPASPAWAEQWWIVLQRDAAGNSTLADIDTVEQGEQGHKTLWTHKFYSTPEERMSSAAIQYEVDCGAQALRERLYTDYDAEGAVLRRGDNTAADQWRFVNAGTVGASIVRFTCTNVLVRRAEFLEIAKDADYREVGRFYANPSPVVPIAPPTPARTGRPAASANAMQAGQRYKACALAAAQRFTSSRETASVIADAALTECASGRRSLAAAFVSDPAMSRASASVAIEHFDQLLRRQLQLEVVRKKAQR